MRIRLVTIAIIITMIAVSVSCSDDGTTIKYSESPKPIDFTIGLVTNEAGIEDEALNHNIWKGINLFSEDTGAKKIYKVSENLDSYSFNLKTMVNSETDLIVAYGNDFTQAVIDVASMYPDKSFLILDKAIDKMNNVSSVIYREEQGAFLMGVVAAYTAIQADRDTVGFIGSGDTEATWVYEAGFEAGVNEINKEIIILSDYISDDEAKSQEIASKMYAEGAYVIYHAVGKASQGIIKEAISQKDNDNKVWMIGNEYDQYNEGIYEGIQSIVLTSMVKRLDVALYFVADETLNNNFPGGQVIEETVANGGVGLPQDNPNLSDEVIDLVEVYKEKIKNNEIEIPRLPLRLQQ